jgi:hypothetical protein
MAYQETITPMLPRLRIWISTPSIRDWKRLVRSGDACFGHREIAHEVITDRICEELRPGVLAMWSDPREWFQQ